MRKIFTQQNILLSLKIFLPILYVCTLIFIFSQSLQTGAQSSQTSGRVVEAVQEVFKIIAPQSPIATAEGEALENLHATIRTLAHFAEFALLGGIACGICLVYKNKDNTKWCFLIGVASLIFMPIADEILQSFTVNRATEIIDFLVDFAGGLIGFGVIAACFYVVVWWINKGKEEKNVDERANGN